MKILILAQTPPPFHGQAIMQKYLVDAKWDWCEKKHIKLNYSDKISEVGKFKFSKIFSLFKIVFAVWSERLKGEIDLLYYPPAGPNRIPLFRDIVTLLLTKWTAKKIIFHFHAGGINELLERLSPIENMLAKISLQKPDASIVLLESYKKEIEWFQSKSIYIIPNGISDVPQKIIEKENVNPINILTVGLISEEKGIYDLIATAKILKEENINFVWNVIGAFTSFELEKECRQLIENYGLNGNVKFAGEQNGEKKWNFFKNADLFVFLSFASEAFPLTLLEAMMFSLPVVATDWRGIPEIIEEGKNGFLVPVKDPAGIAEKIEMLYKDSSLREKLGKKGRAIYSEKFTLDHHLNKLEEVFQKVISTDG